MDNFNFNVCGKCFALVDEELTEDHYLHLGFWAKGMYDNYPNLRWCKCKEKETENDVPTGEATPWERKKIYNKLDEVLVLLYRVFVYAHTDSFSKSQIGDARVLIRLLRNNLVKNKSTVESDAEDTGRGCAKPQSYAEWLKDYVELMKEQCKKLVEKFPESVVTESIGMGGGGPVCAACGTRIILKAKLMIPRIDISGWTFYCGDGACAKMIGIQRHLEVLDAHRRKGTVVGMVARLELLRDVLDGKESAFITEENKIDS